LLVGVLSDTHGVMAQVDHALGQMGPIDALIHAGDFYTDALALQSTLTIPVYSVAGNCDFPSDGPDELTVTMQGHKILITHGHLYRVKFGLQRLFYQARETGVEAVVFGHTHMPLNVLENGILFFNPGSTIKPQPGHATGYGILNIDKRGIRGTLFSL